MPPLGGMAPVRVRLMINNYNSSKLSIRIVILVVWIVHDQWLLYNTYYLNSNDLCVIIFQNLGCLVFFVFINIRGPRDFISRRGLLIQGGDYTNSTIRCMSSTRKVRGSCRSQALLLLLLFLLLLIIINTILLLPYYSIIIFYIGPITVIIIIITITKASAACPAITTALFHTNNCQTKNLWVRIPRSLR